MKHGKDDDPIRFLFMDKENLIREPAQKRFSNILIEGWIKQRIPNNGVESSIQVKNKIKTKPGDRSSYQSKASLISASASGRTINSSVTSCS